MRTVDSGVSSVLGSAQVEPFFAVDLLFDTNPVYTWTGLGSIDYGGNTYVGAGNLLHISDLGETSDMEAVGASVTITGIPSSNISLALSEPYQGRVCKIYIGFERSVDDYITDYVLRPIYDDSGHNIVQPALGPTTFVEVFSGYMDTMNIDKGPEQTVIEIGIQSKLVDLERARVARYTSEYQKSRFSGDLAFDYLNDLQNKEVLWGRG